MNWIANVVAYGFLATAVQAQSKKIVVAQDGTGQFATVQAAFDAKIIYFRLQVRKAAVCIFVSIDK